jgi:hypothetical protein
MVDVRQTSAPVSASWAEMKHTSSLKRSHPLIPATMFPFTTIGPLVYR